MTTLPIFSTTDTKEPTGTTELKGGYQLSRHRNEVITFYVKGIRKSRRTHIWWYALDDGDQENIQEEGDGQETRE
jgi:hypothetical protein